MTRRRFFLALSAVWVAALLPALSTVIASVLAEANGCKLNEAGTNPCLIAGTDRGELLSSLFVGGWLSLVTLPLALIASAVLAALFAGARRS